jgi:hypothetical protein
MLPRMSMVILAFEVNMSREGTSLLILIYDFYSLATR